MADPVFVDCPADVWTLVAQNVTVGLVHKISFNPNVYQQTYRDTGNAVPTLVSDGVVAFESSLAEQISSGVPIDVYIWPKAEAGRVRVDL